MLECLLVQSADMGVSVARAYYHTGMRSDETPLKYLYRLNAAAIQTNIAQLEGNSATSATRRNHTEKKFIATLDDCNLANQLTLLSVPDEDEMEGTPRAYQRMHTL